METVETVETRTKQRFFGCTHAGGPGVWGDGGPRVRAWWDGGGVQRGEGGRSVGCVAHTGVERGRRARHSLRLRVSLGGRARNGTSSLSPPSRARVKSAPVESGPTHTAPRAARRGPTKVHDQNGEAIGARARLRRCPRTWAPPTRPTSPPPRDEVGVSHRGDRSRAAGVKREGAAGREACAGARGAPLPLTAFGLADTPALPPISPPTQADDGMGSFAK